MRREITKETHPIVRKNLDLPFEVLEAYDKKARKSFMSTKRLLEQIIIKQAKKK